MFRFFITSLSALSFTLSASAQAQADNLYQALGGSPGIARVVDQLIVEIQQDARISPQFKETNMKRLAELLKEQLCVVSDGPCQYSGDDMLTVHAQLGIKSAAFNALVEDLQAAMHKNQIPFPTQNRLLARLAVMKKDIVVSAP
ncbi:group 1 truncated hemoglobin [Undibacterium sp. CY7W]|uniref:Group 1 truncated hemoglobin n=1 Tax=Undibacterium rugosum TaxID=2762291 RepID=A0A923I577_9BURK|nr:group 1 truncated hemoglobin [Undibacterium rugosum]MBC3933793.1 group 1 truncated hemoglobin [Undibacterium rugosum]